MSPRVQLARVVSLAVACALAAGCAATPQRPAIPVGPPLTAAQLPLGDWRIVGQRAVGVTSLSPLEAQAWIGRAGRFSRTSAGFPPDTCEAPVYASDVVSVADLAVDYRVRPAELGLPGASVQRIEVRCPEPWTGPGEKLFVIGPNRLVAVWQGVFFELERE